MEYNIVRTKRRTICLQIKRSGEIVVRAPLLASKEEIHSFVHRHSAWLAHRIVRRGQRLRIADGESLSLCGIGYTIAGGVPARVEASVLFLPIERREEALIKPMRRMARTRMQRLLDEFCARFGFQYSSLKITSARGRWGSCSAKKRINFSFRTAFLPDALAEYLAVHELCHTRQMNHGTLFWKEVGRILPDFAARRKALKDWLWAMECL
ncbi:MAG: M48 family metallopeptidase [Clostridia bacterium]|nr:M48 family metallopeptidase [Clostridia bacterium]